MKYRTRVLPIETKLVLAFVAAAIVVAGDRMIHGYFWLLSHFGRGVVWFLQWAGVCAP